MKPIAIFRHSPTEGPGYFATYLDAHELPWRLIKLDEGATVPAESSGFSGLCFMGGPMSVNDDIAWIAPVLSLIREAVAAEVPVIGHCLGGQLMSRALGGAVTRNPVKEIGWGAIQVEQSAEARQWLGGIAEFQSFHWHGETFTIPQGATRLAGSQYCPNQAFAYGKHLAMQCHVEITPAMIRTWCLDWSKEKEGERDPRVAGPSVQSPQQMQEGMEHKAAALHEVAERLYQRWVAGLA